MFWAIWAAMKMAVLFVRNGLAGGILDISPGLFDQRLDARRHRHIVQVGCGLIATLVDPLEELQGGSGLGCLVLALLHHDIGGGRDGPRILAWLVVQYLVEGLCPVGSSGCSLGRLVVR